MRASRSERAAEPLVQIGDLARRVGVRVDTLRVWERRYGLLRPRRSPGGFRLYSRRDEDTVRAMLAEMDRGLRPAQAAKVALATAEPPAAPPGQPPAAASGSAAATPPPGAFGVARTELYAALTAFDGRLAHQLIDGLLAEYTLDAVLDEVVLGCLRDIGDGWEHGAVSVAQEHFASNLVRERLLGLARPWDRGSGPRAILACPAGERHDIGLVCFGIVLGRGGWRVTYLGSDTPIPTVAQAAAAVAPDLVVIASIVDGRLDASAPALRELAAAWPVALAGPGATPELAGSTGSRLLDGPAVAAANRLASGPRP